VFALRRTGQPDGWSAARIEEEVVTGRMRVITKFPAEGALSPAVATGFKVGGRSAPTEAPVPPQHPSRPR
jgi:hypothetical protein